MDLLIDIIVVVGPLILGVYLSTRDISKRAKTVVWIICILVSASQIYRIVHEKETEKREGLKQEYNTYLLERQDLRASGHPQEYIDGLMDNPLTSHHLEEGQKYEGRAEYDKAIEQYKLCLGVATITESNRVAAHILIGNCHYRLSRLDEAEAHYVEATQLSASVENQRDRAMGRSKAGSAKRSRRSYRAIYSIYLPKIRWRLFYCRSSA